MQEIISYITKVISTTAFQLFLILGPILLIAFLMNFFSGAIERKLTRLLGIKLYLLLFGWLGTCVHESGHALFCLIFRHKINEIKFFKPDLETGTLGYVNHSYNPKSPYQNIGNFFIGIGPILLGAVVIYFATYLYLGDINSNEGNTGPISQAMTLAGHLFKPANLLDWKFYLFLYITLSVGGAINLSTPDIKGAGKGFVAIIFLLLLTNLVTLWMGNMVDSIYNICSDFFLIFYVVMIFSIILNAVFALIIPPFFRMR